MRAQKWIGWVVGIASALVMAVPASGQVTIDNGVTGDGRWVVVSGNAGDSLTGSIDPVGATGLVDVIYELLTWVDVGADGGGLLLSGFTSSPATLSGPNQVTSSGSFAGANGPIAWTAVASVPPGEAKYKVILTFSSAVPFGTVRLVSYFDEDVPSGDPADDVLVVLGTPGSSDFFLLTLDQVDNIGVGHAAGFLTALNATYLGWAADKYQDLRTAISTGAGATYSIPGTIDTVDLPPYVEARYPGRPAYGPRDITQAFAFDLAPTATSATIQISLAGSPDGTVPMIFADGFESGTRAQWSGFAP